MKRDPLYKTYQKLYSRKASYEKKRQLASDKGNTSDYHLYSVLLAKTEHDIKFLDNLIKCYKEV